MQTFIELWSPKPRWTDLPQAEKNVFLEPVRAAIGRLSDQGVLVKFGAVQRPIEFGLDYVFAAVWSFPAQALLDGLRQAILDSGWYDYFDQANILTDLVDPDAILDQHL